MDFGNYANATIKDAEGKTSNMKIIFDDKMTKLLLDGKKEEAEQYFGELGYSVTYQPSFRIDENCLVYSPKEPKRTTHKYNTQVTVHLPYLLHIPNDLNYELNVPFPSFVCFAKQWTDKATDSNEVDVLAEKKTYIAGKTTILSPKYPVDPTLGWETPWTGKNVERMMDTSGYFRYSIATIEFDTNYDAANSESNKEIAKEIIEKAALVVNRVLRIYLETTDEVHVQPLHSIEVVDIYFANTNTGLLTAMGIGIGNAIMNHSIETVRLLKERIESDYEPDIIHLLLSKARLAYHVKDYKIAVIESFIATDICVEEHLINKHMDNGKTPEEAGNSLKGTTNARFSNSFAEFYGQEFNTLFPTEHSVWKNLYSQVRIPVIHKGKVPSAKEGEESIIANEKIISCIQSLTELDTSTRKPVTLPHAKLGQCDNHTNIAHRLWRWLRLRWLGGD